VSWRAKAHSRAETQERTSSADFAASNHKDALGNCCFDVAYSKTDRNTVSEEDTMKFYFKTTLAAVLFSAVPIALAQDAATDVKKGADATGHETRVVAKDTAKGTEKAADKTGHATKVAAKDTAKGTETVADKTGHETKVVAKDTAKGTEKVAKKTGSAVKTGAKDTGHEMKKIGGGDKPADTTKPQ
jgi:hypothetical protein